MNELDCVKLIKPYKDLKVGTRGCIVLKYTENDFEVEFFVFKAQKTVEIFLKKIEKFEEKNRNFYYFLVRFKNKNRRKNN